MISHGYSGTDEGQIEQQVKRVSKQIRAGYISALIVLVSLHFLFIGVSFVRLSIDGQDQSLAADWREAYDLLRGGVQYALAELYPVEPMSLAFSATSIAVALALAAGLASITSSNETDLGEAALEEYARRLHLRDTARLAALLCGSLLLNSSYILMWGDGWLKLCAIVYLALAHLCFSLSAAIPVGSVRTPAQRRYEQKLNELRREFLDGVDRDLSERGGPVGHPRLMLCVMWFSGATVSSCAALAAILLYYHVDASVWDGESAKFVAAGVAYVTTVSAFIVFNTVWARYAFPSPQFQDKMTAFLRVLTCFLAVMLVIISPLQSRDLSADGIPILFWWISISACLSISITLVTFRTRSWLTIRRRTAQSWS